MPMVLGSGEDVSSNTLFSFMSGEPSNSTVQQVFTQGSSYLASGDSAIQEQGFSDQLAARIEAPSRSPTRIICKLKWFIFDI